MYNAQYKYTRCGAVSPGDASKVAHDWHRLLTFRLKSCSLFTLFTINRPLPPQVLTVLVWFSSSAHPEKPKKKVCTNDARIARYSAPGE